MIAIYSLKKCMWSFYCVLAMWAISRHRTLHLLLNIHFKHHWEKCTKDKSIEYHILFQSMVPRCFSLSSQQNARAAYGLIQSVPSVVFPHSVFVSLLIPAGCCPWYLLVTWSDIRMPVLAQIEVKIRCI